MELLQLYYFRTVAKNQHMTNAAEELRIAQPALSKTIARLEEDLGVPLFDRQGRSIKLNTFGQAFLRKVETALNALEDGRKRSGRTFGFTARQYSLGCNECRAPIWATCGLPSPLSGN